jgi:hypothetical protein
MGQFYHIYNRGNNAENIFVERRNYPYFLQLYAKHIMPVAQTYAYCILRNHFHFLVWIRTEEEQEAWHRAQDLSGFENLTGLPRKPSQHFSNLFNAYAKAFNKAYGRTGALFERPFGRVLIESEAYLIHLVSYIHQNPQNHGFVDDFRDWEWSSYQALLSTRDTHLERDEVLAWFQGRAEFQAYHRQPVPQRVIAPLAPDDFG